MSFKAKQSTAATYMVGPVLDADGVAVTGGVVGDFKISKNGGAPAALNGSATLTHRHTGFYSLALTASDLDTVGTAQITIDDTVNACPMLNIQVIEEEPYDDLFAASAVGYLKPTTAGRDLDVSAGGEAGVDWANVGSQSTSVNLSATTINLVNTATTVTNQLTAAAIATGVWQDATAGDFTTASSIGKALYIANIVPGASGGHFISGSNAGTTTVGALTVTGAFTVGTNALPWNAAYDAEVQSEVDDALIAKGLDHLVFASVTGTDIADNSIIAYLASKSATADWDSYVNTTDSHEALRDRGDAAWITATGFSTHSAADVWAVGARTLTALDEDSTTLDLDATIRAAVGLATANLDTQLADLPTVAEFEARTLIAASYFDPAADTVANVTTVGSVTTKTGYELAATGLDAIVATTPNGVASTFATKLMQLWARFFGRVTKDSDEIKTYRSDGTTVATTQTYTSSGSDDDVGAAS